MHKVLDAPDRANVENSGPRNALTLPEELDGTRNEHPPAGGVSRRYTPDQQPKSEDNPCFFSYFTPDPDGGSEPEALPGHRGSGKSGPHSPESGYRRHRRFPATIWRLAR